MQPTLAIQLFHICVFIAVVASGSLVGLQEKDRFNAVVWATILGGAEAFAAGWAVLLMAHVVAAVLARISYNHWNTSEAVHA